MNLMKGDCLELMKDIPSDSIDAVICDPPYGTTACKWDSVIPFDEMWKELKRITKDSGAICLFGNEPFSSFLRTSNIKMFKYDWIWKKNIATNFLHAKRMPLRNTETISVFYKKANKYYPIKTTGHKPTQSAKGCSNGELYHGKNKRNCEGGATDRYPLTVINFDVVNRNDRKHPTQKPVKLMEYLIKTYTLEGEHVLDFTMGSGSTGVACVNTGRKFTGIEQDENYFQISKDRISEASSSLISK